MVVVILLAVVMVLFFYPFLSLISEISETAAEMLWMGLCSDTVKPRATGAAQ